ncbi:hypothetical protein AA0242T_2268 [Acetobacter aceti NRIC 0242]|uniref:Uncharacterized protein n=1 Tax=Acetobacter aceti NBRC 14818 TaxID=887700 RepID=A0AB33IJH3_ACEAC|nr:hypothetical protein [Acetobacter aceti]TCS28546.1 hypothetical protein EDC15_12229 [Acetobacter aceti NBRC 14818]BCK75994.1 hypothetical protein EMQ_1600 [Acetobacter aceti NBRC 14818]GAN58408.1 hypothetical protein Abac_049_003 [Acetobacter aceti NBRC 14818]GBO81566.1 hypothetical protein AA0242T_2268 [Acetobacter aceti NRIC 0242]
MSEQDKFVRQYVNALAGDYRAQQDVAFSFSLTDGYGGPVVTNPIQACAWAKVISASGSPYVTAADQSSMVIKCSDLRPMDLEAAAARLNAIRTLIKDAHVKRVAVPEMEYNPESGKDETEADQD